VFTRSTEVGALTSIAQVTSPWRWLCRLQKCAACSRLARCGRSRLRNLRRPATWLGYPSTLRYVQIHISRGFAIEPTSRRRVSFGVFAVWKGIRAIGCGADRGELGVLRLQARVFEPGSGERRCRGIAARLALRRVLDPFCRALR